MHIESLSQNWHPFGVLKGTWLSPFQSSSIQITPSIKCRKSYNPFVITNIIKTRDSLILLINLISLHFTNMQGGFHIFLFLQLVSLFIVKLLMMKSVFEGSNSFFPNIYLLLVKIFSLLMNVDWFWFKRFIKYLMTLL